MAAVLASSGWDNAIRLWDPTSGTCVQILRDLDHPDTLFYGLAWSPDGKQSGLRNLAAWRAGVGCDSSAPGAGSGGQLPYLDPSRGLEPRWHTPGRRGRRWPRLCVGRLRWQAAAAAGGASWGRHERGLEPRWHAVGLRWQRPGTGRQRGALRVGCAQRGAPVHALQGLPGVVSALPGIRVGSC